MIRNFVLLGMCLLTLSGGVMAAPAAAGVPNPTKCDLGSKTACAKEAATLQARRWLTKKAGLKILWPGPLTVTAKKAPLIWRIGFGSSIPAVGSGHLTVTYKATSTGWHVYITRTATG